MGSRCTIIICSILFVFLMSNCGDKKTSTDKVVECRLYWISDTYPKKTANAKDLDTRMISLHYLIINNMVDECFLPIKNTICSGEDSIYCSEMCAYIDNKPIYTWFSADTRWKGVLKQNDSIHAELKIPEWILDSAKVNRKIALVELMKAFNLSYNKCLSDTIHSPFPIPQLFFTYNDTIAIHHRDSTSKLNGDNLCP